MDENNNDSETSRTSSPNQIETNTVRLSFAFADFWGGLAQSTADAFRAFRDELSTNNIVELSTSNGYLKGFAAGNTRFFDGLARTSDQIYADLSVERNVAQNLAANLDYDRLAKLVAAEMKKKEE